MTTPADHDARFDRAARARHQAALDAITPHTLARLRPRPESATRPVRSPGWGWSLAGAGTAAVALAVGFGFVALSPDEPAAPLATAAPQASAVVPPGVAVDPDPYQDALAAFEEDPEMYLWLASAEAAPLAME